ncbi:MULTISPECIES: RagB/SusD family nutrient uptake outer membrane protein [Butyricimonas]|uniref:RagB/SusD family nutrient uptake outer membrane protein n=1 Tax=Butyricimonas TaxID=574697 RepID=UPI001D08BAA2|nr:MULTISPECIES: RagB/SusD family nutrient uptake outer membrane protein [Butyricimonas]MCB6974356.1 RagB/SusD family nutrient uptake outer membrane protein [Butyricimonas synergistica]MCG4521084.1 RagB/SusD family nutrient uptake outer membrane protein [Butyricimonas sp. DFI.6.44]
MKYFRNMILGWLCVCLIGACSDFLEEKSQDEVLVKTASDYSELLLGYMGYSDCWGLLYLLSDETRLDDNQYWGDGNTDDATGISYRDYYTWQPDMWEGTSSSVTNCYKEMYELIMGVNAVLDGIDDAEGDQATKDRVKAEALGLRGFYYHFLVNVFGEPYNCNRQALGVPLKLTAALLENGIARNTVEKVYDQIVKDLEQSSELFRQYPKQRGDYRINGTVVDILLSRVYLYMERWDEAIAAANRAIETSEGLTDYTKMNAGDEFVMASYTHSEVEWVYGKAKMRPILFVPSEKLMEVLEGKKDCRKTFWIKKDEILNQIQITKIDRYDLTELYNTIRISEAYLNRAEAYVLSEQANKNTLALDDLNRLRHHRIIGYTDVSIVDEEDLLNAIREERYAELCFEGHRWFDLRRYGMPSITHDYKIRKNAPWETYTLREKDPLYTLPIPTSMFTNNIQLEQNASANELRRVGIIK